MRGVGLVLVVGVGLLVAFGMVRDTGPAAYGQRPAAPPVLPAATAVRSAQAQDLIVLMSDAQQLLVVDSRTRAVGVYHVDRASGQIVLKSVRNVQADLQMDEFNSSSPTPQEIRSLLPAR